MQEQTVEQTAQQKEVLTEVTTIAEQEAKTGETILPQMTEEEFVKKASISYFKNRRLFAQYFAELSSRGKTRVMSAILDIPTEGVPVFLKEDTEKIAYSIGQQVQQARFIIIQHEVGKEIKKRKAELAAKDTTQETSTTQETVNE